MKQVGRFVGLKLGLGALVATAMLIATAQAQNVDGVARVSSVRGEADYSEGGGTWGKLSAGRVLNPGAMMRTADGTKVELDLRKNGPTAALMSNTSLGIQTLRYETTGMETIIDTVLDLKAGRILGEVDKLAASSRYEVKTPNAVVGVRGSTKYDISANGKVVILAGWAMVVYSDASGKTQTHRVEAGQAFDPATQTVRQATQEELDDARQNMPSRPGPSIVSLRDYIREPFISPISPANYGDGSGYIDNGGDYYPQD